MHMVVVLLIWAAWVIKKKTEFRSLNSAYEVPLVPVLREQRDFSFVKTYAMRGLQPAFLFCCFQQQLPEATEYTSPKSAPKNPKPLVTAHVKSPHRSPAAIIFIGY